jgi:hypothetical protein
MRRERWRGKCGREVGIATSSHSLLDTCSLVDNRQKQCHGDERIRLGGKFRGCKPRCPTSLNWDKALNGKPNYALAAA